MDWETTPIPTAKEDGTQVLGVRVSILRTQGCGWSIVRKDMAQAGWIAYTGNPATFSSNCDLVSNDQISTSFFSQLDQIYSLPLLYITSKT